MNKKYRVIKALPILLLLFAALPVEGMVLQPSTPANYVEALQTANSFLWAWVNRDADAGRRLISRDLSSKLQKEKNEDWFRDYMIGVSNPHHHSFQIGPGNEINPKRFVFPVTLYEYYTGEPKAFKYKSKIELIREGDSWRVDVLPLTADNH
jgi:hypothetical protein